MEGIIKLNTNIISNIYNNYRQNTIRDILPTSHSTTQLKRLLSIKFSRQVKVVTSMPNYILLWKEGMFNEEETIRLDNIICTIHWEGSIFLIGLENGVIVLYDVNTAKSSDNMKDIHCLS